MPRVCVGAKPKIEDMSDEAHAANDSMASSGCFLKRIAALGAIVTIRSGE
jgi:hypothetical protein